LTISSSCPGFRFKFDCPLTLGKLRLQVKKTKLSEARAMPVFGWMKTKAGRDPDKI
jgi:hypothetical protein